MGVGPFLRLHHRPPSTPFAAPKPCRFPACPALTTSGYCDAHKRTARRAAQVATDAQRPSARERGYDSKWAKARKGYLAHHPLCVECERQGRVTAATVVDHVVPHRGDKSRFWSSDNWQSLCAPHHNAKTGRGQ